MSAMSDYLENKLVDFLFRGVAFTPPAGLYVGLFTAGESDSAGGTEVTGGAYARVPLAPTTSNWAATQAAGSQAGTSSGNSGTTSNNVAISFPTPTANWGTIVGIGVFDASSAGNLLWYASLATPQSVPQGVVTTFPAGSLALQIDN